MIVLVLLQLRVTHSVKTGVQHVVLEILAIGEQADHAKKSTRPNAAISDVLRSSGCLLCGNLLSPPDITEGAVLVAEGATELNSSWIENCGKVFRQFREGQYRGGFRDVGINSPRGTSPQQRQ